MTREDQVLGLLAEANPVSDPNLFAQDVRTRARLGDNEQWSGTMTETELRSIEPPARGKNRWPWVVAAAAAVVVLIVGVGSGVAICEREWPVERRRRNHACPQRLRLWTSREFELSHVRRMNIT